MSLLTPTATVQGSTRERIGGFPPKGEGCEREVSEKKFEDVLQRRNSQTPHGAARNRGRTLAPARTRTTRFESPARKQPRTISRALPRRLRPLSQRRPADARTGRR